MLRLHYTNSGLINGSIPANFTRNDSRREKGEWVALVCLFAYSIFVVSVQIFGGQTVDRQQNESGVVENA